LQLAHEESLTLHEILEQEQFRDVRLVVLSACQTTITEFPRLFDEAIGLPAGFLWAGAPGVVSTLWSGDDLSTALVMGKFYEHHLRGHSPSHALRQAQNWLRTVTVAELLPYVQPQYEVWRQAERQGSFWQSAIEGVLRFASQAPDVCPFAKPYYWAPFAFVGV
jgi:CHAT domain-containing protein